MLGGGEKIPSATGLEAMKNVRRSIVAKHDMATGHRITNDDLDWVRPGHGIRPGNEKKILGKRLRHEIKAGEMIKLDCLT